MSKQTRTFDDLLAEALAGDEGASPNGPDDQSAREVLVEVFRGRNRLFAALGVVVNLVFFVIGISAAVAFTNAQDIRTMLLYGGSSALSFAVVLTVKIWYWLEMNRLSLIREIKRVELQVVRMSLHPRDSEGTRAS